MRLTGERCVVRPWRATDVDLLVRHANNIKIASQLRDRFPHPYTRADAEQFLQIATHVAYGGSVLAIEVDGQAAGGVGITLGTDVERYSAEVGYWLGEAYWGRGIVTEAVMLLTSHAFERMNLLRLFALPFADNTRSVRVLEKGGYGREGLLRSSAVKYGKPRDQYVYARVNDAWIAPPAF